ACSPRKHENTRGLAVTQMTNMITGAGRWTEPRSFRHDRDGCGSWNSRLSLDGGNLVCGKRGDGFCREAVSYRQLPVGHLTRTRSISSRTRRRRCFAWTVSPQLLLRRVLQVQAHRSRDRGDDRDRPKKRGKHHSSSPSRMPTTRE